MNLQQNRNVYIITIILCLCTYCEFFSALRLFAEINSIVFEFCWNGRLLETDKKW